MSKKVLEFTCVQCPMGCPLTVTVEDGQVTDVTGNTCPRGKKYGAQEAICPERVVTSLVNIKGDWHPISVKTTDAVPKTMINDVIAEIRRTSVDAPIKAGTLVIENVAGTNVDVVATSSHK